MPADNCCNSAVICRELVQKDSSTLSCVIRSTDMQRCSGHPAQERVYRIVQEVQVRVSEGLLAPSQLIYW